MSADLQSLIDEYLRFALAADPIEATRLGVTDHNAELGSVEAQAWAEQAARRRDFLRRLEAIPTAGLDAHARMDRDVARIDLRTWLRRHEDLAYWQRAAYWYVERLGGALSGLMRGPEPAPERGRCLLARLQAVPGYLADVTRNLSNETPPLYVEMGRTAVRGLAQFLDNAVTGFAQTMPPALQADLAPATKDAQAALDAFDRRLEALQSRAQGTFACGPEHFDFLLREFHLLDLDHRSLHEFGLARMEADRQALDAYAAELDPALPWHAQIERIKDEHPRGEDFLATYRAEMERARAHCVAQDLVTLPAGERAEVVWLPDYLRAGAPLGLMFTTPPFAPGLESRLLITPVDEQAPAEQQRQHQRDNCYAFARSITLHEIYPGHHVQKVHHKLATAGSPMRRYFSSPVFVEGWGLYTEDLMEESGFMQEPGVRLFKLRNALWRSARVVVDSGLHTRGMTFEDAVDLLCDVVHLDRRMAAGEVRRYTTHNNPTYPSAYLLGRTDLLALRSRVQTQEGAAFSLKRFHDRLLGFGSPPLRLVAQHMPADSSTP